MLAGLRNRLLGDRGERIAERALREVGVRMMHRQHRTRCGEIDLIGREADGRYVFCEVKTRTAEPGEAPRYGRPA
ncbi:MAG: YraN family protein, partial [Planctomycetota bacterium]